MCHQEQRSRGILTFCAERGVNLATVARDVGVGFRLARLADDLGL
jgi:hypothetical protein